MSAIKHEVVLAELLKHVPEFRDAYERHIAFNEEVLPYVLFGSELRIFVVEVYQASIGKRDQPENAAEIMRRLSAFLEQCAEFEDKATVGLLQVGFLETLNNAGADTKPILERLGPKTRMLYEEIEAWWKDFIQRKNSGEL